MAWRASRHAQGLRRGASSGVTGAVIPVDGGWALGGASSSVGEMKKAMMGG